MFRVNQTYNSLTTPKSCRRPVVSLSHATKSYCVNRPLERCPSYREFNYSKMTDKRPASTQGVRLKEVTVL